MTNASGNVTSTSAKAVADREAAKAAFLLARVDTETDKDAAVEAGRTPSAIKRWDQEDPHFKLLHKAAVEAAIGRREMEVDTALAASPTDIANLDKQLEDASVDAMVRLREIVSIKITPHTKAADVAQIRLASEKILEAAGVLKPKVAGGTQVNVIVGEYAQQGRKFSPPYRKRHGQAIDVDGKVS